MERIAVYMSRPDVKNIPQHTLPDRYTFRNYADGDNKVWAEIMHESGLFENLEKALETYNKDFGGCEDDLKKRCFFVVDNTTGQAVGSTTAWFQPDLQEKDCGRIHWVGIRKNYQSKGLAKPMLCTAMNYLAEHHSKAYLATNTTCERAIGIYIYFGFKPVAKGDKCTEAWQYLYEKLKSPIIKDFLDNIQSD